MGAFDRCMRTPKLEIDAELIEQFIQLIKEGVTYLDSSRETGYPGISANLLDEIELKRNEIDKIICNKLKRI